MLVERVDERQRGHGDGQDDDSGDDGPDHLHGGVVRQALSNGRVAVVELGDNLRAGKESIVCRIDVLGLGWAGMVSMVESREGGWGFGWAEGQAAKSRLLCVYVHNAALAHHAYAVI